METPATSSSAPRLRRTLTLWDLIFYGIVLIQPIAPVPLYGVAQKLSDGHFVTIILIALFAMLITAVSYGRMGALYPTAGSAYTYVGRGLNPHLGFLAGWAMILDYLLQPLINTVWISTALHERYLPQIYLPESANQYSWRDVNINSWPNGTIASTDPDGTNWLSFSFPGSAVLGLTRRTSNEVWFAWTGSSNSNFKNPQVQVLQINTSNYTSLAQWQIWNDSYAFTYPSLATNSNGEVGVSLGWGGNSFYWCGQSS